MSSYFGPPEGATPPELTEEERRKEQQRQQREQDRIEAKLVGVDCADCGAENDEARLLCSECQETQED